MIENEMLFRGKQGALRVVYVLFVDFLFVIVSAQNKVENFLCQTIIKENEKERPPVSGDEKKCFLSVLML